MDHISLSNLHLDLDNIFWQILGVLRQKNISALFDHLEPLAGPIFLLFHGPIKAHKVKTIPRKN